MHREEGVKKMQEYKIKKNYNKTLKILKFRNKEKEKLINKTVN